MTQVQISPISAAQHYKASADFWEARAKMLQHQLDEEYARSAQLQADLAEAEERTSQLSDPSI